MVDQNRRRLLTGAGAGAALTLTGCGTTLNAPFTSASTPGQDALFGLGATAGVYAGLRLLGTSNSQAGLAALGALGFATIFSRMTEKDACETRSITLSERNNDLNGQPQSGGISLRSTTQCFRSNPKYRTGDIIPVADANSRVTGQDINYEVIGERRQRDPSTNAVSYIPLVRNVTPGSAGFNKTFLMTLHTRDLFDANGKPMLDEKGAPRQAQVVFVNEVSLGNAPATLPGARPSVQQGAGGPDGFRTLGGVLTPNRSWPW